jgi:hypothetical protein
MSTTPDSPMRQLRSEHFSEELGITALVLEGTAHSCLVKASPYESIGFTVTLMQGHTCQHEACSLLVVR